MFQSQVITKPTLIAALAMLVLVTTCAADSVKSNEICYGEAILQEAHADPLLQDTNLQERGKYLDQHDDKRGQSNGSATSNGNRNVNSGNTSENPRAKEFQCTIGFAD